MKSANLILLFFFAVLSITASAQNYYQKENSDELETVFDTLPDGTILNLFEGTIIEDVPSMKQLKSAEQNGRTVSGLPTRIKRQLSEPKKDRLKSAQLIKSLNQETSPYYMEKLDSLVSYEPTMFPGYDSTMVEGVKSTVKLNEDGYLIERIVDTLDINTKTYLKKEKVEYTPDAEGRLLKSLTFNWTGEVWGISQKHEQEYNANGITTLSVDYYWGGSDWINSSKTEYEFDTNGNITLRASYIGNGYDWIGNYRYEYTYHESGERATYDFYGTWDVTENMWTREGKSEYNEQGQRTLYSYKIFNTQIKEWEYSYKYEYEYLEDESIVEIKYGWNADTKELYQQYQRRYKYEREYEGDNETVEIKLNFENDSWEYEYKIERQFVNDKLMQEINFYYGYDGWYEKVKKVYEYDQWGRQILYEMYDSEWYGEITERVIQVWTETGQRIKFEQIRWEMDEESGWFKKVGVRFDETIKDAEGKTLSSNYYKWNEEKEEWVLDWKRLFSYPKEGETIMEMYVYNVNGYYPAYEQNYVSILTYNDTIGKYSGLIEKSTDYDEEYEIRITYNTDLKVDEVLYIYEGVLEDKLKCFYDDSGRDTAWCGYDWVGGEWEFDWKVTFSYQDLGSGQNIISEKWYYGETEKSFYDNYFEDDKLMKVVDQWIVWENEEWVTQDEDITIFNYNQEGQITSLIDESGNSHWKNEYVFLNDTLTINDYYRYLNGGNPDTIEWILQDREVYKVDPNISKNQVQKIPTAIFGDGIMWAYYWHSSFDYGKILEMTDYWGDYETNELEIDGKSVYYYSPASPLQGEVTINGYIFDETGANKSVSITSQISGEPVVGVAVSLCAKENDFVLATDLTDVDGFYEFKGVPVGNFYLKVELDGFEQTSTYDIEVEKGSSAFENKNFNVLDGTVVTGIEELESAIRIYPNPVSNFVNITAPVEITTVKVIDINGRTKIYVNDVNSTNINMTTERLPDGLYIFEIRTNGTTLNKKIIVKR